MLNGNPNPSSYSPASPEAVQFFCNAARDGDIVAVQDCLDSYGPAIVNAQDNISDTALTWAAYSGHLPVVQLLLAHGAELEKPGNAGKTALAWALQSNREDVALFLLEKGASLDTVDNHGNVTRDIARNSGMVTVIEDWVEGNRRAKLEKQAAAEAAAEASAEEAARSAAANRLRKLKEASGPKLGTLKKSSPPPKP